LFSLLADLKELLQEQAAVVIDLSLDFVDLNSVSFIDFSLLFLKVIQLGRGLSWF
jgi:hypothetical protein